MLAETLVSEFHMGEQVDQPASIGRTYACCLDLWTDVQNLLAIREASTEATLKGLSALRWRSTQHKSKRNSFQT
ncbi:hypothetical protein KBK24_0119935 [Burkholderia sp. K24]|nr:hypothetical protein KBK24_0119935 [Burkholderia sp. K24]